MSIYALYDKASEEPETSRFCSDVTAVRLDRGLWQARAYTPSGTRLTCYGTTETEAIGKVRKMMDCWPNAKT